MQSTTSEPAGRETPQRRTSSGVGKVTTIIEDPPFKL